MTQSRTASVAFAPDGRQVALQVLQTIVIIDLTARTTRKLLDLGEQRILAGPGSWTVDGRIALWQVNCSLPCVSGQSVDLSMSYVDGLTGTVADGPRLDPLHEPGARLLGRQSDGDAVAVVYREVNPNGPASALPGRQITDAVAPITGHPEPVALHPGGGSTTLVTVPDSANRIDLARNLLDRFGAAPPSVPTRLIDWGRPRAWEIGVILGIIVAAIYATHLRRRRRSKVKLQPSASPKARVPVAR